MAAPYLLKRRAGWYLRLRIPVGLAPLLGSHLTRTLRKRDYGEARRRAVLAVARLHTCWQEAEGVMASHRLPSDGPLTADDYIRLGRQRLQARLVAGAADLRARLIDDIEVAIAGAVTPCEAVPAPADNRTAALAEARHLGRLEGLRDAMAALGSASAPELVQPAAAASSPPITDGRRESTAPWPSLIERFFTARPSVGESAAVSHRQAFSEFAALIGAKPIGRVSKGDVARYAEWLEGKDVACLDLRVAATKTGNAPRLVPILPALADLGFLTWAADKRAAGAAKLFQGGESCADWSKWTNRYIDAVGLNAPDTATYSLRHCFRQMLRAARIGDELMNKVFGHAAKDKGVSDTGARYGRALSVQEARLVAKAVRPPLSLVHLAPRPAKIGQMTLF